MAIIGSGAPATTSNQAVAYNNIFANGTVTASSVATGYFKENAYDWREDDVLMFQSATTHTLTVDYGAAVSVDTFCLAYHDLGTQSATITIRYSTDNFAADDNIAATLAPSDDSVIFKPFTSQHKRYWRIQITTTSASTPYIGQALLCERLALPKSVRVGYASTIDSDNDEIINNISQNGNHIGMSVMSYGVVGTIGFEFMTTAYMRGSYREFISHARTRPFFYSWRPTIYDDDGIICWRSGKLPTPTATHAKPYWSAELQIEGRS